MSIYIVLVCNWPNLNQLGGTTGIQGTENSVICKWLWSWYCKWLTCIMFCCGDVVKYTCRFLWLQNPHNQASSVTWISTTEPSHEKENHSHWVTGSTRQVDTTPISATPTKPHHCDIILNNYYITMNLPTVGFWDTWFDCYGDVDWLSMNMLHQPLNRLCYHGKPADLGIICCTWVIHLMSLLFYMYLYFVVEKLIKECVCVCGCVYVYVCMWVCVCVCVCAHPGLEAGLRPAFNLMLLSMQF